MPMAQVCTYHVQDLVDALWAEGLQPATLHLERALLRTLFNHARKSWHWGEPVVNPAVDAEMPIIDNGRDRVMSESEEQRLNDAIEDCRNSLVGPTVTLLTETAMRTSEPLEQAQWRDVDWDRRVLTLHHTKTGQRDVPLSQKAMQALEQLWQLSQGQPEDRVVRISYEALKAAWKRACNRAGVCGLNLYDLRHTGATRFALQSGNIFLVQALTGHRTLSMLTRYVNVKAEDVVAFMHADKGDAGSAVVGDSSSATNGVREHGAQPTLDGTSNRVKPFPADDEWRGRARNG